MRWVAGIAIILAVPFLLDCKSNEEDPFAATELANSFLLTLEDFPEGWELAAEEELGPGADSEGGAESMDPYSDCPTLETDGLRGVATSPDFTRYFDFVSHIVAVYDSPSRAEAAVALVGERLACIAEVMNQGGIDTTEVDYSEASVEVVPFEPVGDVSELRRLTVLAAPRGDAGGFSLTLPVIIDQVAVAQDRYWFVVFAGSVLGPIDPDLLASLAQKTVDRMTGAEPVAGAEPAGGGPGRLCEPGVTLEAVLDQVDAGAVQSAGLQEQIERLVAAGVSPCQIATLGPARSLLGDLVGVP